VKKAFPYIMVIGVGLAAIYAYYHFQATRLTQEELQNMRIAEDRLAEVESAEHDHQGEHEHGGAEQSSVEPAATPASFHEIPAESMPDQAPDTFHVAFECSNGTFVVECHRDWAPNGVERFYELVKIGFFNDIRVFRVLPDFVVQFGISGDPALNAQWMNAKIPDDEVKQSNTRGRLTFASAPGQANSRSTQVFVNLTSTQQNTRLDAMGFPPIGEVVQGMDTVDGFYAGYGGEPSGFQQEIGDFGNEFLDQRYPNLSQIKRAYFVEGAGSAEEQTEPDESRDAGHEDDESHAAHANPILTAPEEFAVQMDTTAGTIVVECHRSWAPHAADRFYTLVDAGFYAGSAFAPVITEPKPYIAQFGINPDDSVNFGWVHDLLETDPAKESNTAGRLAFALKNHEPGTGSTQVFINLADNSRLDDLGYAPFGEVVEGMDAVQELNDEYQDNVDLEKMIRMGGPYWESKYPHLDSIKTATIVDRRDDS